MFALILDEERKAVVKFIYDSIAQIGPTAHKQRIGVCAAGEILEIKVGSKSAKSFKIGIISHIFLLYGHLCWCVFELCFTTCIFALNEKFD